MANSQIDLEKAPLTDVISNLQADEKQGLSSAEAKKRLAQYGPNALEAKEEINIQCHNRFMAITKGI